MHVRNDCQDGSAENDGMEIGVAIDKAIDDMPPEDFLIRDFLLAHKAEVKDMCLTEYNEAETMEMFRKEGREQGREEGREETTVTHIKDVMESLGFGMEKAMSVLKIPAEKYSMYRLLLEESGKS